MTQLKELELSFPDGCTDVFAIVFKQVKLILPTIQTLCLSPGCYVAVETCPNVRRISLMGPRWDRLNDGGHSEKLIEAAAKSRMLTQFGITAEWSFDFTGGVFTSANPCRVLTPPAVCSPARSFTTYKVALP